MVTLKDIAEHTGFSLAVVSRALNPRPDKKVAEKTRMTIENASRELGYAPNQAASMLARGVNPAIGLFLPSSFGELVGELASGLATVGNQYGFAYNMYYGIAEHDYLDFVHHAARARSAGIVSYMPNYVTGKIQEVVSQLAGQGCRAILLNCRDFQIPEVDTLCIDNHYGGELAARRLLETGCRRFLLPKTSANPSWQLIERARGFCEYLEQRGVDVERPEVFHDIVYKLDNPSFAKLILELAELPGPTGIFMPTDYEAVSLYHILAAAGRLDRVGCNLRIVGFDNLITSALVYPELTTIAQPFAALGEIAMSLLLNDLVKADIPIDRARLKPRLIVRASA